VAPPASPLPTPLTQPFWDGCAAQELRLQHCGDCDAPFFPPQIRCPTCLGAQLHWAPVSGQATLYSYMIQHRPAPGFEDRVPYAVAIVDLVEGPRMMTNIVGIPNTPEDLVLDMELRVRFERRGDMSLPVFGPVEEA
jgi:uncharacterized OB-fold protein